MNRREFVGQLIAEMAHFVLDTDPQRMVISLHQEPDGLHLAVLDSIVRTEKELESVRSALNQARRPELAGYYGSLAGYDSLGGARLNLIGWQVKGADVSVSDSGTKIDIWLGGDRFDSSNFSIEDTKE
jgi:hypothetical protein